METLKNFTLELNERVVTIEKTVNGNKVHANEVIVEKLEAVQEELTNLYRKIDSMKEQLQEYIVSNVARIDDEINE